MKWSLLFLCGVLAFASVSLHAQARELTPACAAEKERLERKAKEAYQPLDTTVYDDFMADARAIERSCTDEKLLEKINTRYGKQQKKVLMIQQDLAKATDEGRKQNWLDSKTEQLRGEKERLQAIEQERNALLALMGQPVPASQSVEQSVEGSQKGISNGLLTEPLAKDSPAYNQ